MRRQAAGGVVFNGDRSQVLLRKPTQNPGQDDLQWTHAKGGVDPGETLEQAAVREVREELGVHASVIAPIPGYFQSFNQDNHYFVMAQVSEAGPQDRETQEKKWFPIQEAYKAMDLGTNASSVLRDKFLIQKSLEILGLPFQPWNASWIRPSEDSLFDEFTNEKPHFLKNLSSFFSADPFPNESLFLNAVNSSPVVDWTPDLDKHTLQRSHCQTYDCLLQLLKSYKTWGTLRTEATLRDLAKRIETGAPVEMPIVMQLSTTQFLVFSGNTRLDLAYISRKIPQVILVNVQSILKGDWPFEVYEDIQVKPHDNFAQTDIVSRGALAASTESEVLEDSVHHLEILVGPVIFEASWKADDAQVLVTKSFLNAAFDNLLGTCVVKNIFKLSLIENLLQWPGLEANSSRFDPVLTMTPFQRGQVLKDLFDAFRKSIHQARQIKASSLTKAEKALALKLPVELEVVSTVWRPSLVMPWTSFLTVLKDKTQSTAFFQKGQRLDFQVIGSDIQFLLRSSMKPQFVQGISNTVLEQERELQTQATLLVQGISSMNDSIQRMLFRSDEQTFQIDPDILERLIRFTNDKFGFQNETLETALRPANIRLDPQDVDLMYANKLLQEFQTLAELNAQFGLSMNRTVYRGFSQKASPTWAAPFTKKGSLVALDRFMSTSKDIAIADRFVSHEMDPSETTIQMEIDIDESVPQIDVNSIFGEFACPNCNSQMFENEIILVPKVRPRILFVVQSVERVTSESLSGPFKFPQYKKLLLKHSAKPFWNRQKVQCIKLTVYTLPQRSALVGGHSKGHRG